MGSVDLPLPSALAPPPAAAAPVAGPVAEAEPTSALSIRLEAPEGRTLVGTLRIETDEGALVRETEIRGASVAVPDLVDGPYVVRAHVAGFARVSRAIRTPRPELVLPLEPIARVAGRIQGPDGQAHAAQVRIVGSGIWPGRLVTAGADGSFVFEDVPPGVYELEASSDALVAEPRRGLTVDPEASVFVALRPAEGVMLGGQVVDRSTGRPIAGAEVMVSTEALAASMRATLTDATGSFRAGPFVAGPVVLDVRAPGYVPGVATPCRTDAPCRVALAAGASLRGRVLDSDRQPIADAWVEVLGEASDRAPIAVSAAVMPLAPLLFAPSAPTAVTTDSTLPALPTDLAGLGVTSSVPPLPLSPGDPASSVELLPGSAPAPAAPVSVVRSSLRTDADGAFVVSGLPPGRVEVIARAPGHRAARSARLQLTAGRERDGVELVLGVAGRIAARVIDEHGRPADARIEARIEGDPVPRYLETDARGELALEDVGGTVLLLATAEGRPPSETVVHVGTGREERVTIALDAGRRTLRARVADMHGNPLEGALVRVETLEVGTGQPRTLVSDENGEIALAAAPPGALLLTASHPRFSTSVPTVIEGDAIATLSLEEPLHVETTLLDAWTGAGIADAELDWTCLDAAPCFRQTGSGPEGIVDLHRARPGRYRIEVRAAGYATLTREVTVPRPRRGSVVELEPLVIEPAHALEGDVVDPFGRVVEDAEVSPVLADTLDARVVRTDDRGHFVLTALPAAPRTVTVEHRTAGGASIDVQVRRDRDPAPVVVHLPARLDGDVVAGDRARRTIGVGITLRQADGAVFVDRVVTAGARRLGLLPGDQLLAVDDAEVTSAADAAQRLEGSSLVPALLSIRRAGRTTPLRAVREPGSLLRP